MKKKLWKKRIMALLTVAALIVVMLVYMNTSIKAKVNLQEVVVTKKEIPPRTEITEDMLTTISVSNQGIPTNAIRKKSDMIGKWTVSGFGIPTNSFIYTDKIVEKSELPDAGILDLKKGEVAFPLLVDLETSLGNSIIPDTKVDLYFRSVVNAGDKDQAVYGKLASQVRVVAVKDADASNVFDAEGNSKDPKVQGAVETSQKNLAKIYIFAIPESMNELIGKGKLLGEIIPIATDRTYDMDTKATSEPNEVVQYIEQASLPVGEKAINKKENGVVEQ